MAIVDGDDDYEENFEESQEIEDDHFTEVDDDNHSGNDPRVELVKYLSEAREIHTNKKQQFDVLAYWKVYALRFPILADSLTSGLIISRVQKFVEKAKVMLGKPLRPSVPKAKAPPSSSRKGKGWLCDGEHCRSPLHEEGASRLYLGPSWGSQGGLERLVMTRENIVDVDSNPECDDQGILREVRSRLAPFCPPRISGPASELQ
ncbi:hypothetical protein LINPERPRIM_LOCUS5939, partial [Linum perenne]